MTRTTIMSAATGLLWLAAGLLTGAGVTMGSYLAADARACAAVGAELCAEGWR